MYKLIVYDSNNEKVAYIDRFTSLSWKQSIGEVDSLSFELPTKEYDQYLRYGIRLDLIDNNTLLQSFYLRARDIGVERNRYTGLGPLSLLDNIYLPYGFTVQKQNLTDALKALIKEYRTKTLTWKSDWQSCTRDKVDIDSLVGENWYDSVILAKDNLGVYYSNGTIETPGIDLGTDQILNIELRILASVGEDVGVKIRYATSSDGSNWTWYSNGGKDWEYSDYDEFYRISVIGTQRYIKIRCELWTQDTYSEDENGNPAGKSPILQAIQVVTTHNTQIGDNNIATFSKAVAKGEIGEVKNLQGLMDLVRNEKLEIKDGFNPVIVTELGEDKTNTILLHQGMKLTLLDISDDGSSIENYILGYGGGSNIDKLVVIKQDTASILQYGKRVGQYLNSECVDKAQLETETQEYLDEHKLPSQSFRIRTVERFDINLGDTIKVMIPDKNLTGDYRVIEISQDIDGTIEYTLSNKKISLVDMIITPKEKYIPPPKPADIRYLVSTSKIVLNFKAYSQYTEILYSTDNESYRSLGFTDKDYYEHNLRLISGQKHYYILRAVDPTTGLVSDLTDTLEVNLNPYSKFDKDLRYDTFFDSIDGFANNGAGNVYLTANYVCLEVTNSGDYSDLVKGGTIRILAPSWNNYMNFKTRVAITGVTGSVAHIYVGLQGDPGIGFGFYNTSAGYLLGFSRDNNGISYTNQSYSLAEDTSVILEAQFIPGVKAIYYINNSYFGELTDNLPTGNISGPFFIVKLYLSTTDSVIHRLRCSEWHYLEEV